MTETLRRNELPNLRQPFSSRGCLSVRYTPSFTPPGSSTPGVLLGSSTPSQSQITTELLQPLHTKDLQAHAANCDPFCNFSVMYLQLESDFMTNRSVTAHLTNTAQSVFVNYIGLIFTAVLWLNQHTASLHSVSSCPVCFSTVCCSYLCFVISVFCYLYFGFSFVLFFCVLFVK